MSWEKDQLKSVAQVRGGKRLPAGVAFAAEKTAHPYIRVSDFKNGTVDPSNLKFINPEDIGPIRRYTISKDDLYISIAGTLGTVGSIPPELHGAQLTENAAKITITDTKRISKDYLSYVLSSSSCQSQFAFETGKGGGVPKLALFRIESVEIPLPPVPEQLKISDILRTWDKALEKLDALIAAKDRRKRALVQQLLTGRKRVKGFDQSQGETKHDRFGIYPADWKRVALGDIAREVGARNSTGGDLPVLSCTKHRGLVLSHEYFGKRVHAEDTSGYRVVTRGEFAYATNHIEEGSIGYQNLCDAGLVSPIYTVFKTTDAVDDDYLYRVLKSPLLIHFYQINTSASVDRRGSLRYNEFSKIHIWLPPKDEQIAITKIFATADQELTLLRRQREALDQQKRGLMQRLLTGKIRTTP